ncbi:F-box/kelch-repeat protein At3g06240-like [Triticum dicoccoides]|uniref:F-box/kelch-repeat protein At3g06240-like n=1 Tax=Triticum dicoccoides TaxID=85692 RepID=UPI0018903B4E|nr:F-box/kelch-repeat protein At3g06240-like [Triticum dicoccoides]
MAEAAGATPLLPGLPDEITIGEILVRLPPKPLLRCRAVSPAWRRATSARDFLLSHHARQSALPLLYSHKDVADGGQSLDVTLFDHRAGVAAATDQFQRIARLKAVPLEGGIEDGSFTPLFYPVASCDGLLLLSIECDLCICNPATQQYAPLEQLDGFMTVGFYLHPPTGQYRLLLYHETDQRAVYVFSIGSNQPPRHIGRPDPLAGHGLLFRGSLHWHTGNWIMAFDTTTESFRQIRSPVAREDYGQLFAMGDMLGIFFLNDEKTAIDIWVMKDYQGEVWAFKCRVELPVAEIRDHCQNSSHIEEVMVVNGDGELLVLVGFEDWLFQVDSDGKLIASFHARGLPSYNIVHKQSLVQHTFFPTLKGYVINDSPFI